MKISFLKFSFLLALITLFQGLTANISAQNAQGCGSMRYLTDMFDTTRTTVQYGANRNRLGQNQNLFLDVSQPKNDTLAKRPLVILAFGGGFVSGARADVSNLCNFFTRRGYVCATIDYRLYSFTLGLPDSVKITPTMIDAMQDMKAAVRFFRKDAATTNTYRIDPNNIIVGGISAGAITALITGQLDSTDNIAPWVRSAVASQGGFEGASGNSGYSSQVKGIINMSGALYSRTWLDAGDPPLISYHGTADVVVPYGYGLNTYRFYSEGSFELHRQAGIVGVASALYSVQGGGHENLYDGNALYAAQLTSFVLNSGGFTKRLICGERPLGAQVIENQDVAVYPNPSSDVVNIQFAEQPESPFQVEVYDVLGKKVYNSGAQTGDFYALNKSDVGVGMFIVRLVFQNSNAVVVKKISFH
jgi:acetyl esterase/lipase